MRRSHRSNATSDSAGFLPYALVLAFLAILLTIYLGYLSSLRGSPFVSIGLFAMIGGLLFESFKISGNWKNVLYKFVGAYALSGLYFLMTMHFELRTFVRTWPYAFILAYAIISVGAYSEKVTARLNEGVTLLLSISVIYWVTDFGLVDVQHWSATAILIAFSSLALFSIYHAFSDVQLSRTIRLTLSTWSSVIVFLFAADNIFRVFQSPEVEQTPDLTNAIYIGLEYFLLGVSAIYIMQNAFLILQFLPSKSGNYRQELSENIENHLKRYSDEQSSKAQSIFCILFAAVAYGFNYHYQFLPRHSMIWLVIVTFPFFLWLYGAMAFGLSRLHKW